MSNRLTDRAVMIAASILFAVSLPPKANAKDIQVVFNPFDSEPGGDLLERGFYVENYGADNLNSVTLAYSADVSGLYTTSLTVRLDTYDGELVGTDSVTTFVPTDSLQLVTYDFAAAPVPHGGLMTFSQELLGGPSNRVFYDLGEGSHPQITQTSGTTPPLDTFRRENVGVLITAFVLLGDMDCDGDVDFDDIDDFVLGLNSPQDYEEQFGMPPEAKGDADEDGDVDFDDIDDFVEILNNRVSAGLQTIPEPRTSGLLGGAIGLLGLVIRTRRKITSRSRQEQR